MKAAELPRRLKRYPKYKDSGVEWLGEIPAHWEVRRLKTLALVGLSNVDKKSVEGEVPVKLCNYTDVYYHDVIGKDLEFMNATATPEQAKRFALHAGDVLITKDSETPDDIAVPAVVEEDLPGVICGYHLAQVRPGSGLHGGFLARAFAAVGPRDQFHAVATGITRFGLSSDTIRSAMFAIPPLAEQRGIAAFLDRETARIDALVAMKERLIELLQEQRCALITRAVTRGLDPNVPMRDSGVEWLGEIPAHWKADRLKHHGAQVTVGIVVTPSKYYVDEGVRCLRSLNISAGHINLDEIVYISADANDLHRKSKIFEGDVVVVRTGQAGAAVVVPKELDGANCIDLLIIRRSRDLIPEFLQYFLSSGAARNQVEAHSVGAIQGHYNTSTLAEMVVPRVHGQEQGEIVAWLDREVAAIDGLASRVQLAIGRLKELHTAVISAAVTGRIDLREEVVA